jgi:hypothetical protein
VSRSREIFSLIDMIFVRQNKEIIGLINRNIFRGKGNITFFTYHSFPSLEMVDWKYKIACIILRAFHLKWYGNASDGVCESNV